MVKLIKYFFVVILAMQLSSQLFAQMEDDVIADYSYRNYDVSRTIVRDLNQDGVYDTYSICWRDGNVSNHHILAIGDIRRWPPSGIPTRDIMSSNQNTNSLIEAYFTMNTNLIYNWFVKYSDNDTVFYYDNLNDLQIISDVYEYSSESIDFNVAPNPAQEYFEFDYALKQSGWVTITLYSEIGIVVDVIEEVYKNEGNYRIHYTLKDISSGKYYLTVKLGTDELFTRQIVIVK